jgi:hypothetical protein
MGTKFFEMQSLMFLGVRPSTPREKICECHRSLSWHFAVIQNNTFR